MTDSLQLLANQNLEYAAQGLANYLMTFATALLQGDVIASLRPRVEVCN